MSILRKAVECGDFNKVQELTNSGNFNDSLNYSLSIAVKNGNYEIAEFLFQNGARISYYNDSMLSSVYLNDRLDLMKLLLDNGVRVSMSNKFLNPICHSISNTRSKKDHIEIIKLLVDNLPNLDSYYRSRLMIHCSNNNLHEIINLFIDENTSDYSLNTALSNACWRGHLDIVILLTNQGVIPTYKNLNACLYVDRIDIFEYLFNNYQIDIKKEYDEFSKSICKYGSAKILKYLNSLGYDIDDQYIIDNPSRLIKSCIENRDYLFFANLLNREVDLSKCYNVLEDFCSSGYFEGVQFLIEMNMDVNYNNGEALKNACRYNHYDIIEYLIQNGANINFINFRYFNQDIVDFVESLI